MKGFGGHSWLFWAVVAAVVIIGWHYYQANRGAVSGPPTNAKPGKGNRGGGRQPASQAASG